LLKPLLGSRYAWFAMILGGVSYFAYDYSQRDAYSYEGVPKAQFFSLNTWTRVFRNEGLMPSQKVQVCKISNFQPKTTSPFALESIFIPIRIA